MPSPLDFLKALPRFKDQLNVLRHLGGLDILRLLIHAHVDLVHIAVLLTYWADLEKQGNDKGWNGVPQPFAALFEQQGLPTEGIKYAQGVDTVHGKAVTIGNHIFFPKGIDLFDFNPPAGKITHVKWMAHELRHCVQYRDAGGIVAFFDRYMGQAITTIVQKQALDIHDFIPVEREADTIAEHVETHVVKTLSGKVFNWEYYKDHYGDLLDAFGPTDRDAYFCHWIEFGIQEGRQASPNFSTRAYMAKNGDVAAAYGRENWLGAIEHWIDFGEAENRPTI